jgi:hypothetical protein
VTPLLIAAHRRLESFEPLPAAQAALAVAKLKPPATDFAVYLASSAVERSTEGAETVYEEAEVERSEVHEVHEVHDAGTTDDLISHTEAHGVDCEAFVSEASRTNPHGAAKGPDVTAFNSINHPHNEEFSSINDPSNEECKQGFGGSTNDALESVKEDTACMPNATSGTVLPDNSATPFAIRGEGTRADDSVSACGARRSSDEQYTGGGDRRQTSDHSTEASNASRDDVQPGEAPTRAGTLGGMVACPSAAEAVPLTGITLGPKAVDSRTMTTTASATERSVPAAPNATGTGTSHSAGSPTTRSEGKGAKTPVSTSKSMATGGSASAIALAVAAEVIALATVATVAVEASELLPMEEDTGNTRFTYSSALSEGLAETSEDFASTQAALVAASEAALTALRAHLPSLPYESALEVAAAAAALPLPMHHRAALFLERAVQQRLLVAMGKAPARGSVWLLRGLVVCKVPNKGVLLKFVQAALLALMGPKADQVRIYRGASMDEIALALQVCIAGGGRGGCGCYSLFHAVSCSDEVSP